jgi:hypothetical protein
MSQMGRPVKEIDFEQFQKLCEIQCTLVEIAGFFDVSEDTIERRCKERYGQTFAESYKKLSAGGLMSLRRIQFRMAETNPAMAIFLGKNYLGQSDKMTVDVSKLDADIERELAALTAGRQANTSGSTESESIN